MSKLLCKIFGHKYHNDKLLIALSGHNACMRCNQTPNESEATRIKELKSVIQNKLEGLS